MGKKEHCRFLRDVEYKPHTVVITPKRGQILIMDQNILHEGISPTKGTKYVLRTDIIYERFISLHQKLKKFEKSYVNQEEPWERLFESSCKNYAD